MKSAAATARAQERAALEAAVLSFIGKQVAAWAKEAAIKWATSPCLATGEYRGFYTAKQIGTMNKRFLGITYRRVPVFSAVLDPDLPSRFFDYETGLEFRPDMVVSTDWGSVPWTAQKILKKWLRLFPEAFKDAYLHHDGGYILGGMWVRRAGGPWVFVHMTRAQIDALLWAGLGANGANKAERLAIVAGVRVGGWAPWGNYRKRENRLATTGSVRGTLRGDIRPFEGGLSPAWLEGRISPRKGRAAYGRGRGGAKKASKCKTRG